MEENDKKVLRALKFISDNTRCIIETRYSDEGGYPDFKLAVPKSMEERLIKEGYMSRDEKDLPDKQFLITKKGNDYKHQLQDLQSKDYSKWVPITAIGTFISAIMAAAAFTKAIGLW